MTLWFRYCAKEMAKVFFLFVISLYFLFVLIDFSAHAKVFSHHYLEALLYYFFQFTRRLDILLPLALTIASVKVLTSLNVKREYTSMVVGGASPKKLLAPFFAFAFLITAVLYINTELVQPLAFKTLDHSEKTTFGNRGSNKQGSAVHQIQLKDSSLLVYNEYLPQKRCFFDLFWVKSVDHLYRIKELDPYAPTPVGFFVDEIRRNQEGLLVKEQSYDTLLLPELALAKEDLFKAVIAPVGWSLSSLCQVIKLPSLVVSAERSSQSHTTAMATHFCYKVLTPLVCPLLLVVLAPFALQFSRQTPLFLIYALALFGILLFFTLMGSALILAEAGVLPPFWPLVFPLVTAAFLFTRKFVKL